uniref:Cyclin N-terminal domain-containing protein n=1 Tax=Gongylonema pulchrum TaxID=637853 RepID=A0A183EQ07_9BILA
LPAHQRSLFDAIYDKDAYEHMRLLEQKYQVRENFLALQDEINGEMRYILVEWLSDVITDFSLSMDSLHLAVSIVDRTLIALQCPRSQLQLVGSAAMVLASKMEDAESVSADQMAKATDNTY